MSDSSVITIPKTMPLHDRISEVSKQISNWLETLQNPFNAKTDAIKLTGQNQDGDNYCYHYSIYRDVKSTDGRSPYKSVMK
jgi:hypothetical protein